jgi:hypothetical protein
MSRIALVLATLTLGACATQGAAPAAAPSPASAPSAPSAVAAAPAKSAAVNPVGTFEFNTEVNGSPMKGNIRIAGTPGNYSGSMTSDITPELPITSIAVDGQTMKLAMDTPNGAATINIAFTGDTFTGNWELGGASGPLTGKRVK